MILKPKKNKTPHKYDSTTIKLAEEYLQMENKKKRLQIHQLKEQLAKHEKIKQAENRFYAKERRKLIDNILKGIPPGIVSRKRLNNYSIHILRILSEILGK